MINECQPRATQASEKDEQYFCLTGVFIFMDGKTVLTRLLDDYLFMKENGKLRERERETKKRRRKNVEQKTGKKSVRSDDDL